MGRTENFGLSTLSAGNSLDEDGYKYTNADRHTIDRILKQMQDHQHTGVAGDDEEPTSPPAVDLYTTGGNLSSGLRLYYKYTLVDVAGNETIGSPMVYVDTPNPVLEPSAPVISVATTGGELLPGVYNYVLSAYTTVNSLETQAKNTAYMLVNSTTSTNEITLTMPSLPSGATGFNIYRKGPGNYRYYYLASTTGSSYGDDGSVDLDLSRTLPNENRTFSANKVTVSLPGATPSIPEGYTWKIYRTFDQSDWAKSLLHHVVEETISHDDVGQSTSAGSPPDVSTFVSMPDKITLTDAEEIEGSPPPGLLTIPHQVQYATMGVVVEQEGTVPWSCEFESAQIVHVIATLIKDSVAVDDIIVDVNVYNGTWGSIFDPGDRPMIPAAGWSSTRTEPTAPVILERGNLVTVDIAEANEDVATPTALGIVVTIFMMVKSGSETTSWEW